MSSTSTKEQEFTADEIRQECQKMYKQIADAQDRLAELRKMCKHENTFDGNYSYRVGASLPAIICSDCGELIKYKLPIINP